MFFFFFLRKTPKFLPSIFY